MSRGWDIDRDDERTWDGYPTTGAGASRGDGLERLDGVHAPRTPRKAPRDFVPRDPTRRSDTVPAREFALPDDRDRREIVARKDRFRLRDTESYTLVTVGTFRAVFERDLLEGRYHGDRERLTQDVKALRAHGLIDRRTIPSDEDGHSMGVLALTARGRQLLEGVRDDAARHPQALHHGWQKPAEIVHDASLYRMYQVEAAAIEARGDRITRVVLDDELKQRVYAIANRRPATSDEERHQTLLEAGRAVGVPIVDGHLEFPDVRIEYEPGQGGFGRVDLELVTAAYKGRQVAAKQAAGFTLYSACGSAAHGIHSLGGTTGGGTSQERFISSLLSL